MKIGIIGLGVVGNAIKEGFVKLGHTIHCHDLKLNTSIGDVLMTEIVFVCVPTPQGDDGSCDTQIIKSVLQELHNKDLLLKKPLVLNPHCPVVDKSIIPSIRCQGKNKITNRKKVGTDIKRREDNE